MRIKVGELKHVIREVVGSRTSDMTVREMQDELKHGSRKLQKMKDKYNKLSTWKVKGADVPGGHDEKLVSEIMAMKQWLDEVRAELHAATDRGE